MRNEEKVEAKVGTGQHSLRSEKYSGPKRVARHVMVAIPLPSTSIGGSHQAAPLQLPTTRSVSFLGASNRRQKYLNS